MSVVVALTAPEGRSTWIGSDTLYASGSLKLVGPKWIVRPPWAVGVAGHLRSVNILEHHRENLLAELSGAYEFTRRIRELLREDGFHQDSEGQGPGPLGFGQTFILAHPEGAWTIASDFSIVPIPRGQLWAEGSGRELALGAAHARANCGGKFTARDTVKRAIAAAIAFDTICGGEIWLEELTGG